MSNSRSYPSGIRNFSVAINENKSQPVFNYIYDSSVIYKTPQGNSVTGAWRFLTPSDLAANVSISGATISVSSVAVTGTTQTSVINPILPVSGVATLAPNSNVIINYTGGQAIAVSGNFGSASSTSSVVLTGNNSVNVNYTGASPLPVSGVVTVIGGAASSATTLITGSTLVLPVSGLVQSNGGTVNATLTGNSVVTVSNAVTVTYGGGPLIGVSGSITTTPTLIQAVSGLVINNGGTVNAVLTGTSNVNIVNTVPVTFTGGALLGVSGSLTTTAPVIQAVSGIVTVIGGTTSSSTVLTGVNNVFVGYTGGNLVGVSGSLTVNPAPITPVSGLVTIVGGINSSSSTVLTGVNNVIVSYTGGSLLGVSGALSVSAAPIQAVSGFVTLINPASSSVVLTGSNNVNVNFTGGSLIGVSGAFSATVGNVHETGTVNSLISYTGGSLVGVSGSLTVAAAPITPVSGIITVGNTVLVGYTGGALLGVSGSFTATAAPLQAVSGLVTLTNSILPVSGLVVNNGGTVNAVLTGNSSVNINNPVTIGYTGGQLLGVSGNLNVAAAPIQAVSGLVTVVNTVSSTLVTGVSGVLPISGLVVNNGGTVNATLTGTSNVTVVNAVTVAYTGGSLIGVSGSLSTTAAPIQAVSGLVTLTNSSVTVLNPVIAISGIVSSTVTTLQAVSGLVTLTNPASASVVLTGSNSVAINNIPTVLVSGANPIFVTGNFNNNYQTHETGVASVLVTNAITVANQVITGGFVGITGSANIAVTGGSITVANTAINPVLVSGGSVYQFGFNITGVTSGQFQIPIGAISYGWSVESGSAYVNNILINAPMSINGGGYASATILKTAINIGVTGGRVVATWEL